MGAKRINGLFRSNNNTSWLAYALVAILVLLVQTAPHFFPSIAGARPVLIVPFVVCIAVLEGARVGAAFGLICGLLWGVYSFRVFGFDALILMLIGLICGLLVEWYLRANFLSAMLLCVASMLVHSLIEWTVCYAVFVKQQMWTVLQKIYLPNVLYTALLAPAMYAIVLWLARSLRKHSR